MGFRVARPDQDLLGLRSCGPFAALVLPPDRVSERRARRGIAASPGTRLTAAEPLLEKKEKPLSFRAERLAGLFFGPRFADRAGRGERNLLFGPDFDSRRLRVSRTYFVYILASRSRVLYTGVTDDIFRRTVGHKSGAGSVFTSAYRTNRLVHVESFAHIRTAIAREKQIKSWRREKKVALIEEKNPTWEDLAATWFPGTSG